MAKTLVKIALPLFFLAGGAACIHAGVYLMQHGKTAEAGMTGLMLAAAGCICLVMALATVATARKA